MHYSCITFRHLSWVYLFTFNNNNPKVFLGDCFKVNLKEMLQHLAQETCQGINIILFEKGTVCVNLKVHYFIYLEK